MSGKIYLVCKNGEPKYVGFTTQSIEERWGQHCKSAKKPKSIFHKAIRKYGKEAFTIELICEHPNEEYALRTLEPLYIEFYGTHVENGSYNQTRGGDGILGYKHNDEARKKMSEAHLGKPLSENTKRKISENKRGKSRNIETIIKMMATYRANREAKIKNTIPICSKVCSKCGIEKQLNEFSPQRRGLGGRASKCKICKKLHMRDIRKLSKRNPQHKGK